MIRQAQPTDVDQVIPLILIILEDMELEFLTTYGKEKTMAVLKQAYLTEDFRYSYRRALVLVEDSQILGTAFGYNEADEKLIDLPLAAIFKEHDIPEDEQMFIDKEAFEGEWYLDSIAVRPDQRGNGVGAKLLDALPAFAKTQGSHKIGLSVDEANPRAKQLYLRQGFKDIARTTISGHAYDHMQKEI